MNLKVRKSGWVRLGAWPVLAVFLFTETAGPRSTYAAQAASPPPLQAAASSKSTALPEWLRLLPSDRARVESVYGARGKGPFVVLIQDAHSNTEAQKNIAGILEHLAGDRFGTRGKVFVAAEGARGPLHPEYFDFIPEFKEAGEAVVNSLIEKGELSGVELFAWRRYVQGQNADERVQIQGVETTALYRDNLAGYRNLLKKRPLFAPVLERAESALQSALTQISNPELVRFYRERAKRKNGQYGLRRRDAGQGDLGVYADYLRDQSEKILRIDLEDPVEQLRFPHYARMLRLQAQRADFHAPGLPESWQSFAASLPSRDAAEALLSLGIDYGILAPQQASQVSAQKESSPRRLVEALEKIEQQGGVSWKKDPGISSALKAIVLQSEIDPSRLFEEMERLENAILESLARGEEEKVWVRRVREFESLKRLLYLEMTRSDLDQVRAARPDFTSLLESLVTESEREMLADLASQALVFYRQARERDEALVENALAFVRAGPDASHEGRPVLALVSGGFHADGIQEILRRKDLDFALVTPRITQTDQGEKYARVMSGENADLDVYFKAVSPFSTKQEALLFREAMETAVPLWMEKQRVEDITGAVKKIFETHPVLSGAVVLEASDEGPDALIYRPKEDTGAEDPGRYSISSSLLSADPAFSRAVDASPRSAGAVPYRQRLQKRPVRGGTSVPAPSEARSELRAQPGQLEAQEVIYAEENIRAMYEAAEKSLGPDIVIVVSALESERRFWKERLESTRGQIAGRDAAIFSVLESYGAGSPPGNALGSLLAYETARAQSPEQAGVSWEGLRRRIQREKGRDPVVAIYHTAGYGSRVWPITGAEMGSKSRISMPRYLNQDDKKVPMTLLEATIFQSAIFAKNRPGRVMVFWGDQVFIPTRPLESLQSPSESPVEILALAGDFSYEEIVNKYGLIALNETAPGVLTAARLMQKPKSVEAARDFIAAHSRTGAMAKSLGSFAVDKKFWDGLVRAYRTELRETDPRVQARNRADTDGDWWIPLTRLEFETAQAGVNVSAVRDLKSFKTELKAKGIAVEEYEDRVLRLYLNYRASSQVPLMKVINAGQNSLWWDFGNVGVEEGTTEGIFRRNILVLLQDSPEGKLARRFWGAPEPFSGILPGTALEVSNSIVIVSGIDPGSRGVIQNSVLSGVRGRFDLEITDSFLYGVQDERPDPQQSLILSADRAIGYQLKLTGSLVIPSGHVVAGVPILGEDVVLRTTEESDAKAVWNRALLENPVAFGSAAYLIRLAESGRSAIIAGTAVGDLKYRGFFERAGVQHAVIEGRSDTGDPVVAVLHMTDQDRLSDSDLEEPILAAGVQGARRGIALYDPSREILLIPFSLRSELRSFSAETLRPEIERLLSAGSDDETLKAGFLKAVFSQIPEEKQKVILRNYDALRAPLRPYEFTEHFEGAFQNLIRGSAASNFRDYLAKLLAGNPDVFQKTAYEFFRAFQDTVKFSRASTRFFRFNYRTEIDTFIKDLIAEKTAAGDRTFTVKSVGVSSGEEPYSLAMMIYYALEQAYEKNSAAILAADPGDVFEKWAASWNIRIEAFDNDLLNLVLTENGFFDFLYDDPMGFNDDDVYLDEPWLYGRDAVTGAQTLGETWRPYEGDGRTAVSFPFRKSLAGFVGTSSVIRFEAEALDLLKSWMKPVYVDIRGPEDARILSAEKANVTIAAFLRGLAYLGSEDDYLIEALESSRDERYASLALMGNLIVKPAGRSELRQGVDLETAFLQAFDKLDSARPQDVKVLRLLALKAERGIFETGEPSGVASKVSDLRDVLLNRDLKMILWDLFGDNAYLQLFFKTAFEAEIPELVLDAEARSLSVSADYELRNQALIEESFTALETGVNYAEFEKHIDNLDRAARFGFTKEIRERLAASSIREWDKFKILLQTNEVEFGLRSELRAQEPSYTELLQFTSRPAVTNLGDSARVEITFKTDPAVLAKSEMFFHWGRYTEGPLEWTDHEILSWDIEDLGGGIYKASKVIRPGRIGEFGVTAYAQNRVTGERVWQGRDRNDDALIRIDLPEKTVLEDLRRNLKKQEAIEAIRESLVGPDAVNRFIDTTHRLAVDENMRGLGKIVYDAVRDYPRLREALNPIHQRLKGDSRIWNEAYRERAQPAFQALETLGIGEIVFVSPEGPHAIAGGLAKVIEGLAKALSESGVSVTVITPLYEDDQGKKHSSAAKLIKDGFLTETGETIAIRPDPAAEIGMTFGPMYDSGTHMTGLTDDKIRSFRRTVQSRVYEARADGVRYLFLRHPRLADKLYAKVPSSEELRRAVFLSRAALEVVQNRALGVDPQMIISNDWVTGLIPAFLQKDPKYASDSMLQNVGTVHMIHNYGRDYQGRIFTNQYGLDLWPMLGLDHAYYKDVADPNDDRFLNITSSAMAHVNRSVLTVSRPYAEQMLTREGGEGLDNILNPLKDILFGVSNGIDEAAARKTFWKKGEESLEALGLPRRMDTYTDEGFLSNLWDYKNAALSKTQRDFGFNEDPEAVFLSMIGRVAEQKGIQLLTETEDGTTVLESLLQMNPKVQIFLGGPVAEGDTTAERLRDLTLDLQNRYPGRIRGEFTFVPGATTLQVMLASRFFLMPSRYEPGGITQLESLAAGTPVIARNVGGIAATLINYFDHPEDGNGFLFTDFTGTALRGTLAGAFEAVSRNPDLLKTLSLRAANAQNDWHDRIPQYLSLLQWASGVIRMSDEGFSTDFAYLSPHASQLPDLRPRNRSELRSESFNPYGLEENVTRNFEMLDEMHGGRISRTVSERIAAGNKPRVLALGVGRGLVPLELMQKYGDKAEIYAASLEDLLFTPEELASVKGLPVEEAASLLESLRSRFALADIDRDFAAFPGENFDVIVMTQAVMEYMRNMPAVIDRLSERLAAGGELITDLDIMSVKDPVTGAKLDTKAFFESLNEGYEIYGITLRGSVLPVEFFAGLRFTRPEGSLAKLPLDPTASSKVYTARRSELRAAATNPFAAIAEKVDSARTRLLQRYSSDPYFQDFFEEVQWMFPMDHLMAKTVSSQRLEKQIETAYQLFKRYISEETSPYLVAQSNPEGADLSEFVVVAENRPGLLGAVSDAISESDGDIRETYFRVIRNPLNGREVAVNFFEVTDKQKKALAEARRVETEGRIGQTLKKLDEARNGEIRIAGAVKNRDVLLQGEVAAFQSSDGDLEAVAYDVFEDMRENREVEDSRKVSARIHQDREKLFRASQQILDRLEAPGLLPQPQGIELTEPVVREMKAYVDFLLTETLRLVMRPVLKTAAHRQDAGSVFLNLVRDHMRKASESGEAVHGLRSEEIHYVARIVLDQMRGDISVVNYEDPVDVQDAQIEAEIRNFTDALNEVLSLQPGAVSEELAERLKGLEDMVRDILADQIRARIRGNPEAASAEETIPLRAIRAIPLVVLPVIRSWRAEGERAGSQKMLDNAKDLESIFKEVIRRLRKQGTEGENLGAVSVEKELVLFAHELDPFKLIRLTKEYRITAIVTDGAGFASHWVLAAENLNIPVFIVDGEASKDFNLMDNAWIGRKAILDGRGPGGRPVVILNPKEETREEYKPRLEVQESLNRAALRKALQPAVSAAGQKVVFLANADNPEEMVTAASYFGAEGNGLDRTEYLFQAKNAALTRYLQDPSPGNEVILRNFFQKIFLEMGESTRTGDVTIRMFDMQRDKEDAAFALLNPGKIYGPAYYRTPVGRNLLRIEIEAAIRANVDTSRGQIKVLFPMFRAPQDLLALLNEKGYARKDLKNLSPEEQEVLNAAAREDARFMTDLFDEVRSGLLADRDFLEQAVLRHSQIQSEMPRYEGKAPSAGALEEQIRRMKRGIMVETVEGLEILDEMFEYSDFFSVGTNDLTISLFREDGISREKNPEYFDHVELRVFEAIQKRIFNVVRTRNKALKDAGQSRQVSVTVCGGLACMDTFVIMALHEAPSDGELQLSGSAGLIPALKEIVRHARPEDSSFVVSAQSTEELNAGAVRALEDIRARQLQSADYLKELEGVQQGLAFERRPAQPRSEVVEFEDYDLEADMALRLEEMKAAETAAIPPEPQNVQKSLKFLLGPVGLHMFPAQKIAPFITKNKNVSMEIRKENGEVVPIRSPMDLMMGYAEFSEVEVTISGPAGLVQELETLLMSIQEPDYEGVPTFSAVYAKKSYRLSGGVFTDEVLQLLSELLASLPKTPELSGYIHTQQGRFIPLSNAGGLQAFKPGTDEDFSVIWLGAAAPEAVSRLEALRSGEGQSVFIGKEQLPAAPVKRVKEYFVGPLGLHMLPPMQIKAMLAKLPALRGTLTSASGKTVDLRDAVAMMGLGTETSLKKVQIAIEGSPADVEVFEKFLSGELVEDGYGGIPVFSAEYAGAYYDFAAGLQEQDFAAVFKKFIEEHRGVSVFAQIQNDRSFYLNSESDVRNYFSEIASPGRIYFAGPGADKALKDFEALRFGEQPLVTRHPESRTLDVMMGPVGLHMMPVTILSRYLREHPDLKVSLDVPGTGIVDAGNPLNLMTLAVPPFAPLKLILRGSDEAMAAFEQFLREKVLEPDYDGVPSASREYAGGSYRFSTRELKPEAVEALRGVLLRQAEHPVFSAFLVQDGNVVSLRDPSVLSKISLPEDKPPVGIYFLGKGAAQALQDMEDLRVDGDRLLVPEGGREVSAVRSELRASVFSEEVLPTAVFKKGVAENAGQEIVIVGIPAFDRETAAAVISVSSSVGGVYSVETLTSGLPEELTVSLSGQENPVQLSRGEAVTRWVTRQIAVSSGLLETAAVGDADLNAFLEKVPGLPMQAPEDQGAAGFSAEIHVQLERAPDAASLLPVLAAAVRVNGALRLNVDTMTEVQADEFQRELQVLASSRAMRLKPGQIQVRGSAEAGIFATVPQAKFDARDRHALIGREEVFGKVHKRRGQNLFSLEADAAVNPSLFASTLITVLQAMALGKQPEEYFQILNPRSLDPDHFTELLQAVSNYLAAQAKIQAAA